MCTVLQNSLNRGNTTGSVSKFKGVSLNKRTNMWVAQIQYCRKNMHIGTYSNEESAALEYNKMAQKLFGEFAYLNKL